MRINRLLRINVLIVLGVGLILAGIGFHLHKGMPLDLPFYLYLGAAAIVIAALPAIHFLLLRPISQLKKEMNVFSSAWIEEDSSPEKGEIQKVAKGLYRIHQEVDKATLKVKELEATINVYSMEKEQMEAILKSLPIAVLVTDRFSELILANDVAQKLFGFDGEACQEKPIKEIVNWKDLVDLIHGTANRKVKVPRRSVELTYELEGGDSKVLRVILSSISDHTGQILGVVSIIQDATKDREIDRMKSEFVANVSHELKAPLASIRAYTEMIEDGEAEEEETRKEFCSIIEGETNRLSNMIDTLLDLSKLEAGVIQMNMERVNLIKMLKTVEDTMRPNAEKKGISLSTDISQYIPPIVGDEGQLNRVFVNLVSNAIKYTPDGGKVDITGRLEGDLIRVDVSDTGYGIPEDVIPKIFEKFYRVKENIDVAKGTGMGLAMVKRILEIHNAEIKVKSKPGEGSCFSVFLPSET